MEKNIISIKNADLVIKKKKADESTEKTLISSFSFDINDEDIILLSGTNGSGKSSLIKAIFGNQYTEEDYASLKNAEKITFSLEDGNIKENLLNLRDYTKHFIYIDQNLEPGKINRSVEKILIESIPDFVKDKKKHYKNFLNNYKILTNEDTEGEYNHKKNKQLEPLLQRPYYTLSGGQKKWVCILQGLIKVDCEDVKGAFIDEPLNNLDAKRIKQFSDILLRIKYLKQKEKKVFASVIVSHCKAFPRVTKLFEIENDKLVNKEMNPSDCNSCFGPTDSYGFYDKEMNPSNQ